MNERPDSFKFGPLGMKPDESYRCVPEVTIVESIIYYGYAYEKNLVVAENAAREALEKWIALGLPFRRIDDDGRFFDPAEVSAFVRWAGFAKGDHFWKDAIVGMRRKQVDEYTVQGPNGPHCPGERRFTVDFKRTFNLREVAAGTKLRLRLPLPVASDLITDLQMTPFAEGAGDAKPQLGPGRLELRMVSTGEAEVSFGAKLQLTVRAQEPVPGDAGPPPDPAIYLNEKEGLIVVTDRIRALADSLAAPSTPALEVVRAIWDYLNNNVIIGGVHYDQVDFAAPGDWVLDSGWSDCQLVSSLFVSLCRARGIPARVIGGYMIYQVAPANHYWIEVWLDDRGWTPFDFLAWDLHRAGDLEGGNRFFGRLDYRLVCERLPREFTGAVGVPFPAAWCMTQIACPGGAEISLLDARTGDAIYTDTICATC